MPIDIGKTIAITPVSEIIAKRLKKDNVSFKSTDNIAKYIRGDERHELRLEVERRAEDLLRSLVIDIDNDHNTKETSKRLAKMFLNEIFSGRYNEAPEITKFPNAQSYDEVYVAGPITIRSMCAHHLMPIRGKCYIGVFPGTNVVGLSKFNRIVDWICSRPQIQEEMTITIANEVMKHTKAKGVAVLIQAEHFCLTHRGVKEHNSDMTTSALLGEFKHVPGLKSEFFNIVGKMK